MSNKKVKSNTDKILLIVENSEVVFFKQYFNQFLATQYNIKVKTISSGAGDKCDITNYNKMSKLINTQLKYHKAVFLMLDLKTKCIQSERTHTCLKELKKEYLPQYKIENDNKSRFYLFVVCNEIESWFLTTQKDTNNPHDNHKKEIKEHFKLSSERDIVAKMIQELKNNKCQLDFSKNSSLQFFIDKLQQF